MIIISQQAVDWQTTVINLLKNLWLDTKFVDLSRIMNELWSKNDSLIMPTLICI